MINKFTLEEQIIRFIFNELNFEESAHLMTTLIADEELYDLYLNYSTTYDEVKKVEFTPSSKSIENILYYAKAASLQSKN